MASPAAKPRPPPASLAGLPGSAAGCGGEAGPARGGPREPHVPAGPTHMCGAAGRRRASPGSHLWPHGGQSPGGGRGRPQHSVPRMGAARGAAPPAPLPSHVSGAESPTQQPREGAQEAGAWRPGHGRPQEQGRVRPRLCGFRQALPLSGPRRSAPEPWSGAGRPAPIPVSPGAGWAGNRRAVAPLHALVSLSAENGCCAVRRADRRVLHFTGAEIGDQG